MIQPKGMMFNGHDFGPWLKANVRKPVLPPVVVEADGIPGARGTRFRSARLGELAIEVPVRMTARAKDDMAEFRRALAAMLYAEEPAPLVLGDDPRRYYMAVLDGSTDLDTLWHTGGTTLCFRCCDPVAYGERRKGRPSGGVLRVRGTWPTRPVIAVTPPSASYWKIEHRGTGEFLRVNASFNGTARLVIDCEARRCTLNGANADRYLTLDSDYFELAPGENPLSASGGSPVLEWSERWL